MAALKRGEGQPAAGSRGGGGSVAQAGVTRSRGEAAADMEQDGSLRGAALNARKPRGAGRPSSSGSTQGDLVRLTAHSGSEAEEAMEASLVGGSERRLSSRRWRLRSRQMRWKKPRGRSLDDGDSDGRRSRVSWEATGRQRGGDSEKK